MGLPGKESQAQILVSYAHLLQDIGPVGLDRASTVRGLMCSTAAICLVVRRLLAISIT